MIIVNIISKQTVYKLSASQISFVAEQNNK